jgi:hypothetical protein
MADTPKFIKPPADLRDQEKIDTSGKYAINLQGYNVGTYEYPEGLNREPELNHYISFAINVREKSTAFQENALTGGINFEDSPRGRDRTTALSTTEASAPGARLVEASDDPKKAAIAGAGIGGIIGLQSLLKGKSSFLGALGSAAKGAAALGGAALTIKYSKEQGFFEGPGFSSGRSFRLADVITLYMEERPSVRYSANYSTEELGSLAGLATIASASGSLSAAASTGLPKEAGQAIVRNISRLLNLGSGAGAINTLTNLATRTRLNPFREVLFEGIDYRTFNFRYRFFPKNKSESNKINDIIRLFKMHMHPELTTNKLFYIYPSEFQITYHYKDSVNPYLHKFAPCALIDMQVDYGGEQFATFENGAPVEMGLTLTFKELEQIDSKGASLGL